MPVNLIDFQTKGDKRGSLIACEQGHNVPFDIKRVYYIFATKKNVTRGKHAHKKLKQILICVSGSCDVLTEESQVKETYHLDSPNQGLYIDGLVWREMFNFSPDAVLLVLASEYYNEQDYVRSYEEFIQLTKAHND